jgi:hypothetical protein
MNDPSEQIGGTMNHTLRERRGDLERVWQAGVVEHQPTTSTRPEVSSSWERSAVSVPTGLTSAPLDAPEDTAAKWAESRLGRASRVILDDLTDLAASGDMMAALTDEKVTIAWIAGGRTMSRRADRVHFSLGGCWAEDSVGTNALALAHKTLQPSTVFSAEHFAPMVHDWVCYSAPILDPTTGRFLGVLDLSTVWQKAHTALLTTTCALARCVEYELASMGASQHQPEPRDDGLAAVLGDTALPSAGLRVRTLGTAVVAVDGREVSLTRRQIELLTVLSLHPSGLGLDELTGRVYGDHSVSFSTVKAELSHLRRILGGRIGSRPYQLVGPVHADHQCVLDAIACGDTEIAVALYGGPMLPFSESPDIVTWRHHIDVALRDAVLRTRDPDLLWVMSERCEDDAELHEAALAALALEDPRRSIVAGRLAASLDS